MFILSFLSVGFYVALGIFQKEYNKVFGGSSGSGTGTGTGTSTGAAKVTKRTRPVSKAKRED